MTEAENALAPRERGWLSVCFALLLVLVLPATPLLRIVFPIDQTMLLLVPALAMFAVTGWRVGGRWSLALFWLVLSVWVLWQPTRDATSFALLARGWSVIVAATFGALTVFGVGERFLHRALMSLAIACGLSALIALIAAGGPQAVLDVFTGEIASRAANSQAQWQQMTGTSEWLEFIASNPNAQKLADEVSRQMSVLPTAGILLFPSLLALESLAALAVGWAIYHRVGRARVGPPLARWRDLRFDDALIWGIIAGLVIVVLPLTGMVRSVGVNLLVFFGALYAMRGMGVLIWFLAPGRWTVVFLTIFTLLFWHVVGLVAVAIGIGDTWFDWRRRSRPKSQRSE